MSPNQAATEAVRICIRDGVLAPFLEEHGSEVVNMLLEEWNWDEAKEVWQEEVWEMAEAKYQPVIEAKNRENEWLRQKLQEAGIDPRQN
jgi:hypothetical protein